MAKVLELTRDRYALSTRSLFLALGLPFSCLGLLATAKVFVALIDQAGGRSVEGIFLLGSMVAVGFTVIGGAFIFAFLVPKRVLIFDGGAGTLTHIRCFPFNIQRQAIYALALMPEPEVLWIEDSDRWENGYWILKVTLPNGQSVKFPRYARTSSQEKAEVEALREEIRRLMGAT